MAMLGIWSITNQTEKLTLEEFIARRRTWIVPPRDPKETEGKHFIFMLLGFSPVKETDNYDKELENIERMDAVKIQEEGHFYPIVDIQRFACKNGHTRFLCYNCLKSYDREETLENIKRIAMNFTKCLKMFRDDQFISMITEFFVLFLYKLVLIMKLLIVQWNKLQQNIIACLPKHKNFQGVQRVYYCGLILNSKPEYLQYLPEELFKSSKSSTAELPLKAHFLFLYQLEVVQCLLVLIVWLSFSIFSRKLTIHFWRQLLIWKDMK